MRKIVTLAVATSFALLLASTTASAQCAFDGPAKAKSVKVSMVRSFAACPSLTFPGPNSVTESGDLACAPPYAQSDYLFDDKKGACSVKWGVKREDPCSFNSVTRPCLNASISVKCTGVLRNDSTLVNGVADAGWALNYVYRATVNDPDNGDMTVVTVPASVPLSVPKNGSMSVKADTNHLLSDLGVSSFPACAQISIVSLRIVDDNGNPFAEPGVGTR